MRMSIPCRPVSSPMTEFQERFTLREGIPEKKTYFLLGIAFITPPCTQFRNFFHFAKRKCFFLRCLKLIEKELWDISEMMKLALQNS